MATEANPSLQETMEASFDTSPDDSTLSTPEYSLPSTPGLRFLDTSALSSDDDFTLCERPSTDLALRILDIIQKYGHNVGASAGVEWAGKKIFVPLVERSVEKREPVKMVLPAFPCVSVFSHFARFDLSCEQQAKFDGRTSS